MNTESLPIPGFPGPRTALRTASKLAEFALRHSQGIPRRAYLDVGCGNGYITEAIAPHFESTVGIDVEAERLKDFELHVVDRPAISVAQMSGAALKFADDSFSLVTAFEVLEHVPDLEETASEMVRVCAPGGIIVISVPHVWFPIENHGMQVNGRIYERKIPLLPYMRPLHRRWSLARIFSSSEMDSLFSFVTPIGTEYATPQFERAGAEKRRWEHKLIFLRKMLDRCESIPVLREFFGVSMLKAYRKP
ncbi:MAG TPA: class I SAM-dependent methyltransferase [Candidatus Acidoferrales bacterium]|jgi:SAM-dependent methyltransferase|nr:class I SAM-dependent methyltransferase [Candidatus Acidoferrales bacterium]